ncbi:NADPH-dependent F420 reductase [Kitasatospora azatica]|uniref:NADPH-dependent F420 reductase n=1 Tax=Kitasatospora azatica TaxID=58347 RepID=UPI000567DE4A|nr:NAD(P)-binding domain-containing protein [Kitasatospora azatica]
MKIAVLGTGEVGRRLATKLASLGHAVTLGSRTADNADATQWAAESGGEHGTFAQAAAGADLVVNATGGMVSLVALEAAGAENLNGKVLIDVANALDFSEGFPPKIVQPEGISLGEQIQQAFPQARVVKTLNTMGNALMVDPSRVPGHHTVFLSGNDDAAKAEVAQLLQSFGWTPAQITDLGDLSSARGTEQFVSLWLRLYGSLGSPDFNIAVIKP